MGTLKIKQVSIFAALFKVARSEGLESTISFLLCSEDKHWWRIIHLLRKRMIVLDRNMDCFLYLIYRRNVAIHQTCCTTRRRLLDALLAYRQFKLHNLITQCMCLLHNAYAS